MEYIIIAIILICFIVCMMGGDSGRATFSISADGSVRSENDQMISSLTLESNLTPEPNAGYEAVMPTIEKAKKLLEDSKRVRNIKIQPRTEPEYSFDKKNNRTLKGYKTLFRISYDSKVKDSDSQLEASKLQKELMALSNSNAKIKIDDISYYMSDEKRIELESEALRNAILRGKAQARVMVNTTYPGRSFRVSDITTGHSGVMYESVALQAAPRNGGRNIVSQGDSTITASVNMKVEVV